MAGSCEDLSLVPEAHGPWFSGGSLASLSTTIGWWWYWDWVLVGNGGVRDIGEVDKRERVDAEVLVGGDDFFLFDGFRVDRSRFGRDRSRLFHYFWECCSANGPWVRGDAIAALPLFGEEGPCVVDEVVFGHSVIGLVDLALGLGLHCLEFEEEAGLDVDYFQVMLITQDAPRVVGDFLESLGGGDYGGDDLGTEDGIAGREEGVLESGHVRSEERLLVAVGWIAECGCWE